MMRRVWIDTDMGFDDAVAIAMVADAPDVAIAGLSLVAGNAPLDRVAQNARDAATFFGWDVPIHAGRDRPLLGDLVTAAYALGDGAMPTVGRSLPEADTPLSEEPALSALVRYLEEGGSEVLALGPLTNIAALLIARPDLAAQIRLVWMGGSAGPGNHTAVAEFNAAVDPEAIQAVIDAGVRIAMVGLDACRPVTVSVADADTLRAMGGDRAAVLADLLQGYASIGQPGGPHPLYDPVAAAAWIEPATMGVRPARLDAELSGRLTRGMTVIEWRVPRKAAANADIATVPEVGRIRAMALGALERAAQQKVQP
ncbi:nucleoside hydrolase [Inquilinus sp. Marseille-Q2685]|uniref:nucleoside hydrolase n=1 Tax=Inquilinus sp. Marseille-Q2685 TaxID=2866581 RepID=UPI001CE3D550|nr:nucleoside hydrolase [Inquilinus sp. Marseille-Q2685]